ncbi:MAG: PQQ-dependent catabolism-associated CXXCW motif protein [Geminicoccaceae bacterium]
MRRAGLVTLVVLALAWSEASALTSAEHRVRDPELFDAETGYRLLRPRAPTPDDIPGAARISALEAKRAAADGAVLIDVFAALRSLYYEFDGTWLVEKEHLSLPGAIWLPEVGRGALSAEIDRYFRDNLALVTDGDVAMPLVIFCVADCWMSWNAAQRAQSYGYRNVLWFREGTDGWLDAGFELEPVQPVPVAVD